MLWHAAGRRAFPGDGMNPNAVSRDKWPCHPEMLAFFIGAGFGR